MAKREAFQSLADELLPLVEAELPDDRFHRPLEVLVAGARDLVVVPRLEEEVSGTGKAGVEVDGEAVEVAEGWHRAQITVREGGGDLPVQT